VRAVDEARRDDEPPFASKVVLPLIGVAEIA
jgi:hypothetical protein